MSVFIVDAGNGEGWRSLGSQWLRLGARLGDDRLPIIVRPGAPALTSVVLTGAAGEIVLDAERL